MAWLTIDPASPARRILTVALSWENVSVAVSGVVGFGAAVEGASPQARPGQATAQATEAAITNALLAAETTTGANDLRIYALPVDRLMSVMRKYGR